MASQDMKFLLGVMSVLGSGSKVVHHGSKVFWRTRASVDVLIIHHPQFEVLEVVAFNPIAEIEAPHIFITLKLLDSQLESDIKKEGGSLQELLKRARIAYVMKRVNVATESSEFRVKLTPMEQDSTREDNLLKTVCSQPPALRVQNYHQLAKRALKPKKHRKWQKSVVKFTNRAKVSPVREQTIIEEAEEVDSPEEDTSEEANALATAAKVKASAKLLSLSLDFVRAFDYRVQDNEEAAATAAVAAADETCRTVKSHSCDNIQNLQAASEAVTFALMKFNARATEGYVASTAAEAPSFRDLMRKLLSSRNNDTTTTNTTTTTTSTIAATTTTAATNTAATTTITTAATTTTITTASVTTSPKPRKKSRFFLF